VIYISEGKILAPFPKRGPAASAKLQGVMLRSRKCLWLLALLPIVGLGWAMKSAASWRPQVFASEKNVNSVCLSPDGKTILSGDGKVDGYAWDVDTAQARFETHSWSCGSAGFGFSPDSTRFTSFDDSWTLRIWDSKTGKINKVLQRAGDEMDDVCDSGFSSDGRSWLIAGGSGVGTWDTGSGRFVSVVRWKTKGDVRPVDISFGGFSPDRKTFIGEVGSGLRLFDVVTGREIRDLGIGDAFGFSPDRNFFFLNEKDGGAFAYYRISDMKKMWTAPYSGQEVFSPDGKLIYTPAPNGLEVLDAHTGAKLRHLPGPLSGNFAPSPDGNWLYEARDGKIWKWRAR